MEINFLDEINQHLKKFYHQMTWEGLVQRYTLMSVLIVVCFLM